jgi:hypothetical protein
MFSKYGFFTQKEEKKRFTTNLPFSGLVAILEL